MVEQTAEKFMESQRKLAKNSIKPLPKLFIFFNLIKSVEHYDLYLKENLFIPFVNWFVEVFIIRAFLINMSILCLTIGLGLLTTPNEIIALSIGISVLWFLLINLKQDLWRKE